MTRYSFVISNDEARRNAIRCCQQAPFKTRVDIKAPKRTLPQNSRFWAMLSDVAAQLSWHGVKLKPEDWKIVFLDALKREVRMVPNIDGNGFVQLGRSSSDLSKEEMGELMELIQMFGATHGVVFHDSDPTEGLV
jgi:hypothetical protein